MYVQYEMTPCSGFREVQSVDADAWRYLLASVNHHVIRVKKNDIQKMKFLVKLLMHKW